MKKKYRDIHYITVFGFIYFFDLIKPEFGIRILVLIRAWKLEEGSYEGHKE